MSKSGNLLVYSYAKKHWPSNLPKNLIPTEKELETIVKKIIADFKKDATTSGILVRLAGQSGSGKTTQLLPAAEEYFKKQNLKPILIAARDLVKYHPHYKTIVTIYGESDLRKRTDDFATVLMYRIVRELTKKRYDLIIDVSFASPKVEQLLAMMTRKYRERLFLVMAIPQKLSEALLKQREWRHGEKLEKEFFNSTSRALKFYSRFYPNIRTIVWGFNQLWPIYDGNIKSAISAWQKETESDFTVQEKFTREEKILAKIKYLRK